LTGALAAIHGLAVFVALTASWKLIFGLSATLVLLVHGAWVIRRYALVRSRSSIVSVRMTGEDDCELELRDAERIRGRVDPSSFVLPRLIVLRIVERGRRRLHSVVVMADAVREEDFRRLRMRLRWSRFSDSDRPSSGASL